MRTNIGTIWTVPNYFWTFFKIFLMAFGSEIKRLRLKANLSVQKLADAIDIKAERWRKWEERDLNPRYDDTIKIEEFFGLSLDKIMKLKDLPKVQIVPHGTFNEVAEPETYLQKRNNQKNNHVKKDVPVRGGFTNLSNITVYREDPEQYEVIGSLPQNLFPGCDHAERAKGDSMYPLIMNQALLVGKRCSVRGIVMGEKYIIKTKEGLDTTKFIHPGSDNSTIKLRAHNKSIPDQEIDMKDITFVCRVTWIINPT